jgi:O-acetylserine/cysteine efflux transporter
MSGARLGAMDLSCALAAVVIWGLNFVVMKVGLRGLDPMLLGALRFMVAALPFVLVLRRPALPWRYLALYGLSQGLGQFGFLFLGLQLGMTAGMASVVMQAQVFFSLLLAWPLLGERAHASQWLGLAVAMAGLLLIATAHGQGPGSMTLAGFVLTLAAAFMWAVSNIVARRASQAGAYDPLAFIAWSGLFPIVPFLALATWRGDGPARVLEQAAGLSLSGALSVLYLALLATLLAYSLWTRLLQRHPAASVAPFSLLVPVVGLWAAWFFFDERPLPLQWLGTALVLAGLLVNQAAAWWRQRRMAAPA